MRLVLFSVLKNVKAGTLGNASSVPAQARANESGYAVAELAMVLPALVMVAFLGLWIVNLGITELTMQTQVSQIARSLARGEKAQPEIDRATASGAALEITSDGSYMSVTVTRGIRVPLPNLDKQFVLHASSTARNEIVISE